MTECYGGYQNMVSLKGITGNKLNITPCIVIIPGYKDPKDIGESKMIKCSEMYTFVLSNRKSIVRRLCVCHM